MVAVVADAVVIITQNWLHGPQAVHALRAGKHVYSAVPTGITVEEIATLVRTVEESGLVYMLGETSYYYPAVLYCRRRYAAGDFGAIVCGEAGPPFLIQSAAPHDTRHSQAGYQLPLSSGLVGQLYEAGEPQQGRAGCQIETAPAAAILSMPPGRCAALCQCATIGGANVVRSLPWML